MKVKQYATLFLLIVESLYLYNGSIMTQLHVHSQIAYCHMVLLSNLTYTLLLNMVSSKLG